MNESRITRRRGGGDMSKMTHKKRLSEKELGTLYTYCGSPLRLHDMLEKTFPKPEAFAKGHVEFDATSCLAELHDSLSAQGPDDALLSLALMGWIIEDYSSFYYEADDNLRVLVTELKCEAENVIHDLGRLRIDLDSYRAEISEKVIHDHLAGVPDSLCILASIFAELQTLFQDMGRTDLGQLCRLLGYQGESQADHARAYVDMMTKPSKDAADTINKGDIPMPYDMQPDQDGSKIIDLSLFRRR